MRTPGKRLLVGLADARLRVLSLAIFLCAVMVVAPLSWSAEEPQPDKAALEQGLKHIKNARKLFADKRYEKAILEFEAVLRIIPKDADALYNIGVCYSKMGKNKQAKAAYQRLLAAYPDDTDGLTSLGEVHDLDGDTKSAEECYRKAIAVDPDFGKARNNLGVLLEKQGRSEEAMAEYLAHYEIEETKPLAQRDPYAYYSLGVAHLVKGDIKEAKAKLTRAYEIDPASVYINNALGNVYVLEKNAGLALSHFMTAKKNDPNYPPVYEGFGDVYRLQGDTAKAVEAYKKAIQLRPDFGAVYYKLGEMAREKKDPQQAIVYFQNYLKYGKNPAEKERVQRMIEELQRRQ